MSTVDTVIAKFWPMLSKSGSADAAAQYNSSKAEEMLCVFSIGLGASINKT